MTDANEPVTEAVPQAPAVPTPHGPHNHPPNRLYQAAAWVAIVAGVLFIVGGVFVTGFALGRHSGFGGWMDGGPRHHRGGGMVMPRQMDDRDDDMGPGMMGPGMMGPGMMGPGMMGPGMRGPGAGPNSSTPAPAPPGR